MRILVTGGTGFVGGHVVPALREAGHEVRALVRRLQRADGLAAAGAELADGDVTDASTLPAAVAGCDAVVHLVSIRRGSREQFERVMAQGTRDLVAAAATAGLRRFVLMSAAGTNEHTASTVPYFRAKLDMEQAVQAAAVAHVILRPSFVFGPGGGALPIFVRQVRFSPVTPVIGAGLHRVQPIWVGDLAAYVVAAVERPEAANRVFELGGPDVVTWDELYERIATTLGKRRTRFHIPAGLMRAGAGLTEWLPGAPITRDEIAMIEAGDNVASDDAAVETFALPLVPLVEQLRRSV